MNVGQKLKKMKFTKDCDYISDWYGIYTWVVQAEFISGGLEQTSMLKKHLYSVAFGDPKKCLCFEKVRFSI